MPVSLQPVVKFPAQGIRSHFPAITRNPGTIFLDNAATTQMPENVLAAVRNYYESHAANPGRGSYDWAEEAQEKTEQTRRALANLVKAPDTDGIVFTSGATMGLNMVAQGWGRHNLSPGDEILLCLADHHSMVLPWEELAKEKNLAIRPYRLHANGSINLEDLQRRISARTRLCCVTHVNNTAGWINDLAAIRSILPAEVLLNVDAAQSVSHAVIDMQANGIDFLSFSGHKMFALGGIGALCVSPRVRNTMRPLLFGGGMAEYRESDPFYKQMEAGSPNMAGIVSLKAACEFLSGIHFNPLKELSAHLYRRLLANPRIDMLYEQKPYTLDHLSGIASFTMEGWDSGELGDILAENGIFVRTGRHCAGVRESVRISLQLYNGMDEIDKVCDILDKLSEM